MESAELWTFLDFSVLFLQTTLLQCAPFMWAHLVPHSSTTAARDTGYASTHLRRQLTPALISNLLSLWYYLWDLDPVYGLLDFVFVVGYSGVWISDLPTRLSLALPRLASPMLAVLVRLACIFLCPGIGFLESDHFQCPLGKRFTKSALAHPQCCHLYVLPVTGKMLKVLVVLGLTKCSVATSLSLL